MKQQKVLMPFVPPKPVKQSDGLIRQQKVNKEPAVLPEVGKTLVVFYDGQELPREFTGQDGQVYRLREIPAVVGPPPMKPPKPEKGLHIVRSFCNIYLIVDPELVCFCTCSLIICGKVMFSVVFACSQGGVVRSHCNTGRHPQSIALWYRALSAVGGWRSSERRINYP